MSKKRAAEVAVKGKDVEEVDASSDAAASESEAAESEDEAVPSEETKKKRKRKKKSKTDEPSVAASSSTSSTPYTAQLTPSQVYVEGLPFEATEDEIRSFFTSFGCAPILSTRLPTWQDTGRLKGNGHIVFASAALADKAIKDVDGKVMPGHKRYVSVQRPKEPKAATASAPREQPANCSKVFIKNLPYDATEAEVEEVFRVCGKINADGVRLVRNAEKQVKGFGYVEYKTAEGAAAAVAKAAKPFGMTVSGRPVFVDFDEGKPKSSFKGADGRNYNKTHKTDKKK